MKSANGMERLRYLMNLVESMDCLRYGANSFNGTAWIRLTLRNKYDYLYEMNSVNGTERLRYAIPTFTSMEQWRYGMNSASGMERFWY